MPNYFICSTDWLAIHDGGSTSAPMINGQLCGTKIPSPIFSSGNELYVRLKSSDDLYEATGYRILIEKKGIARSS